MTREDAERGAEQWGVGHVLSSRSICRFYSVARISTGLPFVATAASYASLAAV